MPRIRNLSELLERVENDGRVWTCSVVLPHEKSVVEAVMRGCAVGFVRPVLFGNGRRVRGVLRGMGGRLPSEVELVECNGEGEAVERAVEMVHSGDADVLVKGLVQTGTLLREVITRRFGMSSGKFLSHVTVFDAPRYDRLMLLTDAGLNVSPNVRRKVQIVRNAVEVARALGMRSVRVAMLAAVDVVRYGTMQATVDAALVSRIAEEEMPDVRVDGPFALDIALSPEAARLKGKRGRVAGRADVLCAPDIEAANILYKALQTFCGATLASVVVGAAFPVVVPSRADSADSKYASLALACHLAGRKG